VFSAPLTDGQWIALRAPPPENAIAQISSEEEFEEMKELLRSRFGDRLEQANLRRWEPWRRKAIWAILVVVGLLLIGFAMAQARRGGF